MGNSSKKKTSKSVVPVQAPVITAVQTQPKAPAPKLRERVTGDMKLMNVLRYVCRDHRAFTNDILKIVADYVPGTPDFEPEGGYHRDQYLIDPFNCAKVFEFEFKRPTSIYLPDTGLVRAGRTITIITHGNASIHPHKYGEGWESIITFDKSMVNSDIYGWGYDVKVDSSVDEDDHRRLEYFRVSPTHKAPTERNHSIQGGSITLTLLQSNHWLVTQHSNYDLNILLNVQSAFTHFGMY